MADFYCYGVMLSIHYQRFKHICNIFQTFQNIPDIQKQSLTRDSRLRYDWLQDWLGSAALRSYAIVMFYYIINTITMSELQLSHYIKNSHINTYKDTVFIVIFRPKANLMQLSTVSCLVKVPSCLNKNGKLHPFEPVYCIHFSVSLCDSYPIHFPPC